MLERTSDDTLSEVEFVRARRKDLGCFLRERRGRFQPADVALPSGGRRHVRGLRRDEVAALANIGVSWYTLLEQGRVENASARTLAAVARALRLSALEREHLFLLAAGSFNELNIDLTPPSAEIKAFIERATVGMAFIVSPRFDVIAFNRMADDFFRFSMNGPDPNLLRIMLGDPVMRERFIDPDWRTVLGRMVGHFRSWTGRVGGTSFRLLTDELRRHPEFVAIWDAWTIERPPSERSKLRIAGCEPFDVNVMAFASFQCPTYTIIFKTLVPPHLINAADAAPESDALRTERTESTGSQRRADLGAFLRQRREHMRPEDIGLIAIGRRHAKGLRRDEVAQRAGIGTSWYTMLEQGRVENATQGTLRSVADALALTHRERLYLERLTVQSFAEYDSFDARPGPDLLHFISSFPDGHAHFHDAHFDMLAWNDEAEEFYGFGLHERPNMLEVMVRNSALRTQFAGPTWEEALQRMLAHYRFTHALFEQSESDSLIATLSKESPEFRAVHRRELNVVNPASEFGQLIYPRRGPRNVNVLLLTPTGLPLHTLVLKIDAGSADAPGPAFAGRPNVD